MSFQCPDAAEDRKLRDLLRRQDKNRGFLVVFEGPAASGKTTQRKLFKAWMRSGGHEVVTYRWNSSPLISPILKARKTAHSLSPEEYCLLSAAAFRHQLNTEILPARWAGKVVVADQFLYTALARDMARGLDLNWVLNAYLQLFWPDQVFYFVLSAEAAAERGRAKKPGFYAAGQDVTNIANAEKSHLQFLGRVIQEYEALAKIFQFLKVDARQSIYEQHREIRQMFMAANRRPSWAEWNTDAVLAWLSTRAGAPNGETGKEDR